MTPAKPRIRPLPVIWILIALLLVIGGTWCFIEILDEVKEGEIQQFDDRAIRALRQVDDPSQPLGPPWVHEVARDATALGGVFCISMITLFVLGYLLLEGKRHTAILVVVATGGGVVISTLLKYLVARDRPDLVPHLSHIYTSSFPSGHSMLSAVVYLTLGSLLTRITERRWVKIYFLLTAVLAAGVVGISRVYMGVHYPTDVLAGWSAGLAWALLCWVAATMLQRRHIIEYSDERSA